eukprot:UN14124
MEKIVDKEYRVQDRIVLKDYGVGTIVEKSRENLVVRLDAGSVVLVPRNQKEIVCDDPVRKEIPVDESEMNIEGRKQSRLEGQEKMKRKTRRGTTIQRSTKNRR